LIERLLEIDNNYREIIDLRRDGATEREESG
jgi:hypothetical protein